MKMLWVVQRFGSTILGGSEQAVRMFAEKMRDRGHDVTVLTSCAKSYVDWANSFEPGESIEDGIRIVRLPVERPRDQKSFQHLHELVLREQMMPRFQQFDWARSIGPELVNFEDELRRYASQADVVIFKAYLYSTATLGILALAGHAPIAFHPEAHPEPMLNLPLMDLVFRLVDAYQFNSVEERKLIQRRFQFDPPGLTVGIGVDDQQFEVGDSFGDLLGRFHLKRREYFVCLGRMAEGKGSYELLRAFLRIRERSHFDYQLVFVGEKPDYETSADYVQFTGYVSEDEKRALLAGAVALIQPSRLESFSIVLMEAWAAGSPVIVQRDSEVLRGHVERSAGGLCYSSDSELEESLTLLATDTSLRKLLGDNGKAYVQENFAWPQVEQRFEEVLLLARSEFNRKYSR